MIILHKEMTIFPEDGKSVNVNTDRALHFLSLSSISIYKNNFQLVLSFISKQRNIFPVFILHFT